MPKKSSVKPTGWSLKQLFESFDDPKIDQTFADLAKKVTQFESYRDELRPSLTAERFLEIIRELETIDRQIMRLYGFAELSFAANTQDQKAQTAMSRVQQFYAEKSNKTMFFELWWKALDARNAERLLKASGDYRYWLEQMRNFKPYTLTEAEEKIINLKNVTGSTVLNTLYDSITNRYVFKLTVDGKERDDAWRLCARRGNDPILRAKAYQNSIGFMVRRAILGIIYQDLWRDCATKTSTLRDSRIPWLCATGS